MQQIDALFFHLLHLDQLFAKHRGTLEKTYIFWLIVLKKKNPKVCGAIAPF